jgi:hypothetical protein
MPKGTKARLELFSEALAMGKSSSEAAHIAGYPAGSSFASNARKRAQRSDVKARVAELRKPALDKLAAEIDLSVEWALGRLYAIASPDLGKRAIKTPDQLRAIELLAKIRGWMAPDKLDLAVRSADRMTDDELARIAAGSSAGAVAAPSDPPQLT